MSYVEVIPSVDAVLRWKEADKVTIESGKGGLKFYYLAYKGGGILPHGYKWLPGDRVVVREISALVDGYLGEELKEDGNFTGKERFIIYDELSEEYKLGEG